MTFATIRQNVMNRLNLTSPESSQRIGFEINDRYKRVTSSLGLTVTRRGTVTADSTIGSSEMTFDTVEHLLNVIDRSTTPYRVLDEITVEEMRDRPTTGRATPRAYAILNTTAHTVTILMDCVPTAVFALFADAIVVADVLSGSMEPVFPESFHDIIEHGVLADEYRKMEKESLAHEAESMYIGRLGDLRMFLAVSNYLDLYQGKTNKTPRWCR